MLNAFEPWHLLILTGAATVLFGAKRLPASARSIGQSLRILRAETAASPLATDQTDLGPLASSQDATAHKPEPTTEYASTPEHQTT